jgi:hypothetical protein
MDRFEEGWEYDAEYESDFDSAFDLDDAEGLYLSLIPDEERQRFWSERIADTTEDELQHESLLFADRRAEVELGKEIRLSELWGDCRGRPFTMDEFLELSMLVTEVNGIRGSLCTDCAMLGRPSVSANWALASTTLCRGHLRFRLGHAEIDGGSTHQAS